MIKITKARAALVLSQPFFGTLALHLQPVADPSIETMAVDGKTWHYNPAFVERLSFDELAGVAAHEVMHLACAHHVRRGHRNPRLWNIAADYAINGILLSADFTLPGDRLHDPRFDNLSAEEIYAILEREEGQRPDNGGNECGQSVPEDPGGCGAVRDVPAKDGGSASRAERAQAAKEWEVATLQAAQAAKAAGQLPAALERTVQAIRQPAIDWREALRRFVQVTARNDYRWTPPNRRYLSMGYYLPSLRSEDLGPVVVAFDTSGSISQTVVTQFAAEVSAILEDCHPEAIYVLYCDTKIGRVDRLSVEDLPVTLNPVGGGGTDFRPPFTWVEEQGILPACLIYLTDLRSKRFPEAPDYPVLWAPTSDKVAPFGETLRIGAAAEL